MNEARRGQCDLGSTLGYGAKEVEIFNRNVPVVPDWVGDFEHQRRVVLFQAVKRRRELAPAPDDSFNLRQEVDVERRPSKIPVGNGVQARSFLELHSFADTCILDHA